jgi:hypothetical protein
MRPIYFLSMKMIVLRAPAGLVLVRTSIGSLFKL